MKNEYIEFELTLGNGEKCKVRYCDKWSTPMFGTRTVHFEFLGSRTISHTLYRSHFTQVPEKQVVSPEEAAKEVIEAMTGIKFKGETQQQVMSF